jgi:hypothetical protein
MLKGIRESKEALFGKTNPYLCGRERGKEIDFVTCVTSLPS